MKKRERWIIPKFHQKQFQTFQKYLKNSIIDKIPEVKEPSQAYV